VHLIAKKRKEEKQMTNYTTSVMRTIAKILVTYH